MKTKNINWKKYVNDGIKPIIVSKLTNKTMAICRYNMIKAGMKTRQYDKYFHKNKLSKYNYVQWRLFIKCGMSAKTVNTLTGICYRTCKKYLKNTGLKFNTVNKEKWFAPKINKDNNYLSNAIKSNVIKNFNSFTIKYAFGLKYRHINWKQFIGTKYSLTRIEAITNVGRLTCKRYLLKVGWVPEDVCDSRFRFNKQLKDNWNKPRVTTSLKYLNTSTERIKTLKSTGVPKFFQDAINKANRKA